MTHSSDVKESINQRAAELGCVVIQTKPGVILAKRLGDDSFITWAYKIDDSNKAEFYWGHYDMDLGIATLDFDKRLGD